jgi:hypothetical protein
MVNVVDAFHTKTPALLKAVDLVGNLGVDFALRGCNKSAHELAALGLCVALDEPRAILVM